MKSFRAALCVTFVLLSAAWGADKKKPLPNQAGNDDIDVFATVLLDRTEIEQAAGAEMPDGFAAVKIRVVPKADQALRIGPDDFTLVSRKDGERSPALDPAQITGKAGLILKAAAEQPSTWSTVSNGPIWGGVRPTKAPPRDSDRSERASDRDRADKDKDADRDKDADKDKRDPDHPERVPLERENTPEANPVLAALKAKAFGDQETKKPVEGLLYFSVEGKLKPKDLSLIYKSPVGIMVVDFR